MALAVFAPRGKAPSSAHAPVYRFETLSDVSALERARESWNQLDARIADSRLAFQTFSWVRDWAVRWSAPGELSVALGYVDGRLALVWPMIARRSFGVLAREHLGEPMSQYHGALIDPEIDAAPLLVAAISHLVESGVDALHVRRLRTDSLLSGALLQAGARIQRAHSAPFVDLARLRVAGPPGKTAANRRRRLRRLEAEGSITFARAMGSERATEWIRLALAFKRSWALDNCRLARAPFDPRFERGFLDALAHSEGPAALRVFAMLCNGQPIGVEISLACRGRLFGHILAYEPALANFGLGGILADASIRAAADEGFATFDMLAPADAFKGEWADGEVGVEDLFLPLSSRGVALGPLRERWEGGLRYLAQIAPSPAKQALLRHWESRFDNSRGR